MPKSHPPYPPEYRRRMVEMVRSGMSPEALARKFEPTAQAIRNWVTQADRDEGKRQDGLTAWPDVHLLTCARRSTESAEFVHMGRPRR